MNGGETSRPTPPEVLDVESIVLDCVGALATTANVTTTWSDRGGMWFVEATFGELPGRLISVGVDGDTFFIHSSKPKQDQEIWGRKGQLPYDELRMILGGFLARIG